MKAICIMNLKGGVGKTVTAINLGAILARDYKQTVLLVDCDSQHNTTDFFGISPDGNTLSDMLKDAADPYYENYIMSTEYDRLDALPADDNLMDLDITQLRSGKIHGTALVDLVTAIEEDDAYDYVIFDCPPAFNAASAAALVASTDVIIPIKLDAFSLTGLSNMLKQIASMHSLNPRLRVAGCLITMWTKAAAAAEEQLRCLNPKMLPVFDTVIRRSDKVDGSTFDRDPLCIYSPRSSAGRDYRTFAAELRLIPGIAAKKQQKGGRDNG